MKFLSAVRKRARVSESDAIAILKDIEGEVGHDENLIKAVVDAEREGLKKRLRKKNRGKAEESVAYS